MTYAQKAQKKAFLHQRDAASRRTIQGLLGCRGDTGETEFSAQESRKWQDRRTVQSQRDTHPRPLIETVFAEI